MAQIVEFLSGSMNSEVSVVAQSKADQVAVDVVIVNYNSADLLNQCLGKLLQDASSFLNITVVDNGSEDSSIDSITPLLSKITLIKNSRNKGFSHACNQGAALGQSSYLAFVNPDCFVSSIQIQALAKLLENNTHAALVGCRVLNADGSLQAASRRRLPTFWRVLFHVSKLAKFPIFKGININGTGIFDNPVEVEAVNGACYVVKRTDFEQINGFDEGYPLHFEDLDLFTRLLKINKSILYESKVEVMHLQGKSKQDSSIVKAWKKRGLKRYFQKFRPTWEAKLLNWFL